MTTLAHMCGADLSLDAAGGLGMSSAAQETREMILRRLCTGSGDYIWQIQYGAGLPAMIGEPVDLSKIKSLVQSQILMEEGVDLFSLTDVSISQDNVGGVYCTISYSTASSAAQTITVKSS
ncbi:phage tail protein [Ameyamaea chiangmaiensis NBRC 103196]|uniref:Phage tail protein n=1 Tax=Ameyamaea chiangmaiensis TaxID=442969 RepID=A0A850P8J5_9PROT|nr:phage tail protein [Ameyamaea chiangmaiensis]MBS4075826.1 phage tail protein [Ameyamaea chiangmaiensis]NVN39303.1 phage tail protein [Ameyamaea chiangmaiensis]GBQ63890.1 phage tail protein [Ameyamaea chiangmaiensis NBRC 103196]